MFANHYLNEQIEKAHVELFREEGCKLARILQSTRDRNGKEALEK